MNTIGELAVNQFNGRKIITTDVNEITKANIHDVLAKAMSVHQWNRGQIRRLFEYEKGNQNILYRVKDVRPEIIIRL